jgi:hypothetical protein
MVIPRLCLKIEAEPQNTFVVATVRQSLTAMCCGEAAKLIATDSARIPLSERCCLTDSTWCKETRLPFAETVLP